jgi:hypothetical protein
MDGLIGGGFNPRPGSHMPPIGRLGGGYFGHLV